MSFYADLAAELHEISVLLSSLPGWQEFVDTIEVNGCINEICSDLEIVFSADQKAVFVFWRIANVSLDQDCQVCNEYEGVDPDEELMLFSLRVWKEEEVLKQYLVSQSVDFAGLAGLLRDHAPNSRQESEQILEEFSNRRLE